jgi:hypothetical protein
MSVRMQKLHPAATSGANSVTSPRGVIRAILAGALVNSVPSVNHRLPSEPLVMSLGWLLAVGTRNCFSLAPGAASATPVENASAAATATASKRPIRRDMSPTPEPAARRKDARQRLRPAARSGPDAHPAYSSVEGAARSGGTTIRHLWPPRDVTEKRWHRTRTEGPPFGPRLMY